MYTKVKKILDVSKEKDIDILVSRDTLVAEDGKFADEYFEACNIIKEYYKFITACRNEGDEASIKKLCSLYEEGKAVEIREMIKED